MTGHAWSRPRPAPHDHRRGETSRLGLCIAMVTVGTAVASRPPYRSRRALLTHRAPPNWMNLSQLRRTVWLRRLSDASQSRFTLLKNHHRLGWLPETAK